MAALEDASTRVHTSAAVQTVCSHVSPGGSPWPAGSVFCPTSRNISTTATFAWMAIVTGFAVAVGIFLVVVLFTHAVRDLQSAPSYHRLCRRLRKGS